MPIFKNRNGVTTIPINEENPNELPTIGGPSFPTQQPNFNLMNQLQQNQQAGNFQGGNVLSNLDPALQNTIQGNIQGFASGALSDANRALSNQALATQIRDMRARQGGFNAPNIGQGAASAGQDRLERNILQTQAQNFLQRDLQDIELRKFGTGLGLNLAQQNEASKQFGKNLQLAFTSLAADQQNLLTKLDFEKAMNFDNLSKQLTALNMQIASNEKLAADANYLKQQGIDLQNAQLFGYTDPNTGKHVMGTMEIAGLQFQAQMNSQIGTNFANYVSANLASGINDPALKRLGQDLWESMGNPGVAPDWWIEQRIAAVKDPKLTNPIVATQNVMQQAFESGAITEKEYNDFMVLFAKSVTNPNNVIISDSWQVLSADGSVLRNYQTQAEAEYFLNNTSLGKDKGSSIKMTKNGWIEYPETDEEPVDGGPINIVNSEPELDPEKIANLPTHPVITIP